MEIVLDGRSLDEARSHNLAQQSAGLAEFDQSLSAEAVVAHVARGQGTLGDKSEEDRAGSKNRRIVSLVPTVPHPEETGYVLAKVAEVVEARRCHCEKTGSALGEGLGMNSETILGLVLVPEVREEHLKARQVLVPGEEVATSTHGSSSAREHHRYSYGAESTRDR